MQTELKRKNYTSNVCIYSHLPEKNTLTRGRVLSFIHLYVRRSRSRRFANCKYQTLPFTSLHYIYMQCIKGPLYLDGGHTKLQASAASYRGKEPQRTHTQTLWKIQCKRTRIFHSVIDEEPSIHDVYYIRSLFGDLGLKKCRFYSTSLGCAYCIFDFNSNRQTSSFNQHLFAPVAYIWPRWWWLRIYSVLWSLEQRRDKRNDGVRFALARILAIGENVVAITRIASFSRRTQRRVLYSVTPKTVSTCTLTRDVAEDNARKTMMQKGSHTTRRSRVDRMQRVAITLRLLSDSRFDCALLRCVRDEIVGSLREWFDCATAKCILKYHFDGRNAGGANDRQSLAVWVFLIWFEYGCAQRTDFVLAFIGEAIKSLRGFYAYTRARKYRGLCGAFNCPRRVRCIALFAILNRCKFKDAYFICLIIIMLCVAISI